MSRRTSQQIAVLGGMLVLVLEMGSAATSATPPASPETEAPGAQVVSADGDDSAALRPSLLRASSPSPAPPVSAGPRIRSAEKRDVQREDLLRTRMILTLQAHNPRLGLDISERIANGILRCDRDQELDPQLVLAVLLVESGARPHATSPKGAIGLMQVMPYMFEALGLPGSVTHIEANIEAGCLLLADNIRRLGVSRGISAYFWGSHIQGDGYLERVRGVLDSLEAELAIADERTHG